MLNPKEAKDQTFLLNLSDTLRAQTGVEAVGTRAVEMIAEQLAVDRVYLVTLNPGDDNIVVSHEARRQDMPPLRGSYRGSDFPNAMKEIFQHTIVYTDVRTDARLTDMERMAFAGLGAVGFMATPIRRGNETMIWAAGALSTQPRSWTAGEVALFEDAVERTWAAVERAKVEAALRLEDQRKDEFMAMLGHELRNPLAVVANTLMYLELSKGEDPSLPYPLGIQRMSRQVKHLGRMVDDLLEVSRIRQGKIRLQRQRIDLGQIVEQAVEATGSLGQQPERTVEVSLPASPVWVNGDATRLAQVVTNLLTNAAKYTDEGGHIWISLEQQMNQAILQVKDDGMGIPADYLTAIFDVFVQGETSLDRPHGGLGLGLAVVKQIVDGHDGQIEAHSEGVGHGSEFVMKLPLLVPDAAPQPPEPASQPGERSGVRVLIVDDNRELIDLMGKIMQMQGYEVHLRYNGQEGIEAAEVLAPDVVLLDVGMPFMDGYAVCRHIRQQAWGKHLPIIALTGFGQEADKQRSWAAGFDEHLLKPIDYTTLSEVLARTIAAKQEA